ncbi:nitrite/sulfite reductase [Asticcacaulis excentricus]|uniref:Ferredoxin--nitrite reductase n=1 Tax=Asticcacaulis excentricus (strain ATCC 15261 / DSM 4724 / KCTC 12464 / NCIMB 9791 / VKM B-1370 / CB 48) TaxID=573065 RepID=E8RLU3_ASTEC|nr:nitrite/sulfite reductase [Asticcacaulis excentricus]ADU13762.1 Ferredoxin--nitrite reductase [Asticcacaulis excentricus CB 48]
MYQYDQFDHAMVAARNAEFKDQVERRLKGELSEDQFKPLRLMNGLYLQLHAYMLRIAVPYGVLSSRQMRTFAHIARTYDRDFGHFTTRQNIQFNWIKLADTPQILEDLAAVEMHAIQTSGNCIRNTTTDQFAGAAKDEIDDPRPWAELIRQWSTFHPEFTFLPRKFKIAITGATRDRAAIRVHDIGLQLTDKGFDVYVGGGMGRTPHLGHLIKSGLPGEKLLSYLEAALRVYNRYGRRDNIYKARIKILVSALGPQEYARQVEDEWATLDQAQIDAPHAEIARIKSFFPQPTYTDKAYDAAALERAKAADAGFARWVRNNTLAHRRDDHVSVTISLKPTGLPPGDASSAQMDVMADAADRFGYGELRVSHEQNVILPHVAKADLYDLYRLLDQNGLSSANVGKITDMIACPGLDYCSLANARSIPLAQDISQRFADAELTDKIGDLQIKISGCINACGHHHVGHIGILGVDKQGEEFYQILLGGRADESAALGVITGKGLSAEAVPAALERLIKLYLDLRTDETERFIDTVGRLGRDAFAGALHEPA